MNSIARIISQLALVLIPLCANSLSVDAIVEPQVDKSLQQSTDQLSRQEDVPTADIEPLAEQRAILSSPNGYQSLLNKNSFLFGSLAGNRNRSLSTDIRDSRCKYFHGKESQLKLSSLLSLQYFDPVDPTNSVPTVVVPRGEVSQRRMLRCHQPNWCLLHGLRV